MKKMTAKIGYEKLTILILKMMHYPKAKLPKGFNWHKFYVIRSHDSKFTTAIQPPQLELFIEVELIPCV